MLPAKKEVIKKSPRLVLWSPSALVVAQSRAPCDSTGVINKSQMWGREWQRTA